MSVFVLFVLALTGWEELTEETGCCSLDMESSNLHKKTRNAVFVVHSLSSQFNHHKTQNNIVYVLRMA